MESFEVFTWANGFKRFWATVMSLLTFIVVDFSESLLKMLLSAFVLIAPFPNAVSVFNLSQTQLGFNIYSAVAFSAGIEFGPFVMIAISLMLFDGYLTGGKRWLGPFIMVTVSTIVLVILITIVVYWLEMVGGGLRVMSLLPWVSVAAFIGLASLTWHKAQPEIVAAERKEEDEQRKRKLTQRKEDLALKALEESNRQRLELMTLRHAKQLEKLGATAKPTKANGLFNRKETVKNTAKPQTLQPDFAVESTESLEVGGRKPEDPILQYLRSAGRSKTSELAEHFEVSKPTITNRLAPLIEEGLVQVEQVGQTKYFTVTLQEGAG